MLSDDAFARLVAEEVKNNVTQAQRDLLRLPENWSRWQRALVALVANLDGQLDSINEREQDDTKRYTEMSATLAGTDDAQKPLHILASRQAEYADKRKKIERFRHHVEDRLDEVTRMIALGTEAVEERLQVVMFLRRGIERHREMLDEFDLEATPVDKALWAVLEGKWEFDSITAKDLV